MNNVTYLNQISTAIYNENSFKVIQGLADEINRIASMVGVSAGAIAGAIIEENDSLTFVKDDLLDFEIKYKLDFVKDAQGNVPKDTLGNPISTLVKRTHQDWVEDYQKAQRLDGGIDAKPTVTQKLSISSMVDVGIGNFRVARAIKIVEDHSKDYPELAKYKDHYDVLVDDLSDKHSSLTPLLYAIYLKEGEKFFTDKGAYEGQWQSLPQEFKDALLISYVNVGEPALSKKMKNPYFPEPMLDPAGGASHIHNAEKIAQIIGLGSYTSNMTGVESFKSMALQDNDVGMATRYALLNLRNFVVEGMNYKAYNEDNILDLPTKATPNGMSQTYIDKRSEMIVDKLKEETHQTTDRKFLFTDITQEIYVNQYVMEPSHDEYSMPTRNLNVANAEVIFGGKEGDTITSHDYGTRNDFLFGGAGNDTLNGGKGSDYLEGDQGDDTLDGGEGNDTLIGGTGNDTLKGGDGLDYLQGGDGDDTLDGGTGNDTLIGGTGILVADGGDGNDIIIADIKDDIDLKGGAGNDIIDTGKGADIAYGGVGNDTLIAGDDDNIDFLYGEKGNDLLIGSKTGKDILNGGEDSDLILSGAQATSMLIGGTGSDRLVGGTGKETYSFKSSELGTDSIKDPDGSGTIEIDGKTLAVGGFDMTKRCWIDSTSQYEIHKFTSEDGIQATLSINKIGDTKNTLYIEDFKQGYFGLTFGQEPTWDKPEEGNVLNLNVGNNNAVIGPKSSDYGQYQTLNGGGGNDRLMMDKGTILGGDGNDFISKLGGSESDLYIDGGVGNDLIFGGKGKDYILGGSGSDFIMSSRTQAHNIDNPVNGGLVKPIGWQEGNALFSQYDPADRSWMFDMDFYFKPVLDDRTNSYAYFWGTSPATTPDMWIKYQFGMTHDGNQNFEFMNDYSLTNDQAVVGLAGSDHVEGGAGDDFITGSSDSDELYGNEDNDYILGLNGDDKIYGGSNNDATAKGGYGDNLFGGGGNDFIDGGTGKDKIVGGYGNDTLYGGVGDDYIEGDVQNLIGTDAPPPLTDRSQFGSDLIYGGSGDDTIWANDGDDIVHGGADKDIINGGKGNDFLYGDSGIDNIWGGDDNDYLFGGDDNDNLYGDLGDDYLFGEEKDDILHGGSGNDKLDGGAGSDWLYGEDNDDILDGGAGVDHLFGGKGDDILIAGKGNDILEGGEGSDIYIFDIGDGVDEIKEDMSDFHDTNVPNFVQFKFDSTKVIAVTNVGNKDLRLDYGDGDAVIVKNYYTANNYSKNMVHGFGTDDQTSDPYENNIEIAEFRFADGVVWDTQAIMAKAPPPANPYTIPEAIKDTPYFVNALVEREDIALKGKTTITYTFPADDTGLLKGVQPYTQEQKDAVKVALAKYTEITGIEFIELNTNPDLKFFLDDLTSAERSAYAGYASAQTGEVHINSTNYGQSADLNAGNYGFEVLLHEIGHALGLKHSFEAPVVPQSEDTQDNTVMSYTSNDKNDTELKLFDVATLQYLYGVNKTIRAGNDNYSFTDKNIWDGAGNDTFDASTETTKVTIDLHQGGWSYRGEKNASILADGQSYIGFNTHIENAKGGSGNDTLISNELNNVLEGGAGQDTYVFSKGDGIDTIIDADTNSTIVLNAVNLKDFHRYQGKIYYSLLGDGLNVDINRIENWQINGQSYSQSEFKSLIKDLIEVQGDTQLSDTQTHAILVGSTAATLIGNAQDNILIGNDANNTLDGGLGIDQLAGGQGDDIYIIDNNNDSVTEQQNAGTDTIKSSIDLSSLANNVENLELTAQAKIGTGNSLDNRIIGNDLDNILDGKEGNDTLIGGLGNDTYYLDSKNDAVIEQANAGIDTIIASVGYTLLDNQENLTLVGTAISAVGNELDNTLIGNENDNILIGNAGNDILEGGKGDDTYIIDNNHGQDIIIDTDGNNTIELDNIDTSKLLISGSRLYYGDDQNSCINFTINDTTQWKINGDILSLATLQQKYHVDVISANDVTLSEQQISANLVGGNTSTITGNDLNNTLTGNWNDNTLIGSKGNDVLIGGTGQDTYIFQQGDGLDTIQDADNYSRVIINNAVNDHLYYQDGILYYNLNYEGIKVDLNTISEWVINGISYSTSELQSKLVQVTHVNQDSMLADNIDIAILQGNSNLSVTGNTKNNTLIGNAGNNSLTGGKGDDILQGNTGQDTYIFQAGDGLDTLIDNDSNSRVIINNAQPNYLHYQNGVLYYNLEHDGINVDLAAISEWVINGITYSTSELQSKLVNVVEINQDSTLADNIDVAILQGTDSLKVTGNPKDNTLIGNAGDNIFDGAQGVDTLIGKKGNDTYFIDNAQDQVIENINEGNDTINSSVDYQISENVENIALIGTAVKAIGNALDNYMLGNDQNNLLDGGIGRDTLRGGSGDDTYIVDNPGDTIIENSNEGNDTILTSTDLNLENFGDSEIENLVLTNSAIKGVGNKLDNLIIGNAENNTLEGRLGNDTYQGNKGDDIIFDVGGNNTIVLNKGDGADVLKYATTADRTFEEYEFSNGILWRNSVIKDLANEIKFQDVQKSEVSYVLDGNDLLIKYGINDSFRVENFLQSATLTKVIFTDGKIDSLLDIYKQLALTINGTEGNDNLTTSKVITTIINAQDGDDTINIEGESHIVNGGNGNDLFNLKNTANDTLSGGEGIDTFAIGNQTTNIIINDFSTNDIINLPISTTYLKNGLDSIYFGFWLNGSYPEGMPYFESNYIKNNDYVDVNFTINANTERFMDITYNHETASLNFKVTNTDINPLLSFTNIDNSLKIQDLSTATINLTGGSSSSPYETASHVITSDGTPDYYTFHLLESSINFKDFINAGSVKSYYGNTDDIITGISNYKKWDYYSTSPLVEYKNYTQNDFESSIKSLPIGDIIFAGGGNNYITTGIGSSAVFSAEGKDVIIASDTSASDIVHAGAGNDIVYLYDPATNALSNQSSLKNSDDYIFTNEGDDEVFGSKGYSCSQITTGEGNDYVELNGSVALVDTGNGDDHVIIKNANESQNADSKYIAESSLIDTGAGDDKVEIDGLWHSIITGDGNDTINVKNNVTIDAGNGDDLINANGDNTSVVAGAGNDTINIYGGYAIGNEGNDVIKSLGGTVTLDGGAGADTLIGGKGDDTFIVDDFDTYIEDGKDLEGGYDTIEISKDFDLSQNNFEAVTLLGDGNFNVQGDQFDNIILGNSGNNRLIGAEGNDTLIGNEGNDYLDGGIGNDTMEGGDGDDYYVVDNASDIVTEFIDSGIDTIEQWIDNKVDSNYNQLQNNIENLILKGQAKTAFGNDLDNTITLNAQNNFVNALAGNDTIIYQKGGGQDTLVSTDDLNATDSLVIQGYDLTNAVFTRLHNTASSNDMMQIRFTGSSDTITLLDYFAPTVVNGLSSTDNKIDRVVFQNNGKETVLTQAQVDAATISQANNHAPTVSGSIGTIKANQGVALNYKFASNIIVDQDAWDKNLNYNITQTTKDASGQYQGLPSWLSFDPTTQTLVGTPPSNFSGNLSFFYWGTDMFGNGTATSFSLTVIPPNQAPIVASAIADQTATSGKAYSYSIPSTTFKDPDNDALSYTATLEDGSALPTWLNFNASTRTFTGTPPDSISPINLKITAKDTANNSVSDVFTLSFIDQSKTLTGTANADTLVGGTADDTLSGLAGNDTLKGGAGNDKLDGGLGADTLIGGTGNDTYVIDNTGDVITENANEGTDTVQSSITYTLGNNLENLTLTGTTAINGTGNALDNVIIGNTANNILTGAAGNDTLDGGTGADTLIGGTGNDTYVIDNTGDVVTENANEGTDTIQSSVTYTLGNNLENLTLTGTTAINGTGNTLDNVIVGNSAINTLTGGAGNDTLDGGAGADKLIGGTGNDTYFIDNTGDVITENANEGTDTVQSTITMTLGANLENLTLLGTSTLTGTGNALNNILLGNAGNNTLTALAGDDTLDGGLGDDLLVGGAGNDTYIYRANQGVDTIDNSGGGTETLVFQDIDDSRLSFHRDNNDLIILIDKDLAQQVRVKNHFVATGDAVLEGVMAKSGKVITAATIATQLVPLPSTTPTTTSPTAGDDIMRDTLGNDILQAGAGNDTYYHTGGSDTVTDTSGTDTLIFSNGITFNQVASNMIQSGDNLILQVSGSSSNQVTLVNYFKDSNSIIETISFEAGGSLTAQQIYTAFGKTMPTAPVVSAPVITGDANNNDMVATTGNDSVQGLAGNDRLQGLAGNDTLDGGAGNDIIVGGSGNDTLIGGTGNDMYYFKSGFGQDTVVNADGGVDNIYLDGITFNQVSQGLTRSNNDFILKVAGTTDQITIKDFFLGGSNADVNISFAAGSSLSASQIFSAFGVTNPKASTNTATDYQNSLSSMLTMMSDLNKTSPLVVETVI